MLGLQDLLELGTGRDSEKYGIMGVEGMLHDIALLDMTGCHYSTGRRMDGPSRTDGTYERYPLSATLADVLTFRGRKSQSCV